MSGEPPSLDRPLDDMPPGEAWVETFERANGFSGLSQKYRIPFGAATVEKALAHLEFPVKGIRPRTPAQVLSTINDLVVYLLQTNAGLQITGWDKSNANAGRIFLQHVIGGCKPAAVDYAVQRVLNLSDPEREYAQKAVDAEQTLRLLRLDGRFATAARHFTPPSQLWTISPDDMAVLERQADTMFPSQRPRPRLPQQGR